MIHTDSLVSVFKATPLPMLVLLPDTPHFTIAEANLAFFKATNTKEKEIEGKSIFDVFPLNGNYENSGVANLVDSLQKVIFSKKPDKMPVLKYAVNVEDGSSPIKRYYQCENIPLLTESGKIEYILFTSADVTEKEMAVRQLKSDEKKLLAAQQIAKIGYWKFDILKNTLFWSEEVYKILGVNKGDSKLSFELFFQAIHPEDKEMFVRERSSVLAGEKDMDVELRIIQPNGNQKWIHEIGKLVKNEKGETIVFEGTVQDITSGKLLKMSLEESNLRYHYASKATFDAIYDWDFITDKCYWGEGFIRDFGYDLETLSNNYFWEKHVHPGDHDRVINEINNAKNGTACNWLNEYRFQKTDGSYAYVLDRSIIIRDKNGKAIRMIGAVQDISENKNLQRLLDKANRLARIGSWEIDVESASVYWSDITKEIRETPPGFKPTLHEGIKHFKEGYSRETIIARVKEAVKNGTSWQEDLQIYTHKGNLKWMRTIGKAEIVNGKCKKIYGSFQDIDESKKAELEIIKLYEEKDAILESIGDAFFRVENNWLVTYWNKEAERMLLTPKSKIIGQYLWNVFPNSIGSLSYKKYHESIETNKRVAFEDYYPELEKWFEVSAYPTDNGLSVYFKDITERKLSHIQLNESEKRYSELFRLNPQPIWIYDLDTFKFVQVNQAAIDLYGYSEEEFLNLSVFDIRSAEDSSLVKKSILERVETENGFKGKSRHCTKAGKLLDVEIQSNFVVFNDHKYRLVIITDVTEKNRMEQQITRAIIKTQENERYEIGAELHDNICQILASTHISLGVLARSVNPGGMELFQQCRSYINLATQEIRNLSHRLAPAFFNDSTLEEAFGILLNDVNIEKKYNITLYFDEAVEKSNISRDLQLNLYRILQEQLRNILKYAQCKNIEVDLIINNHKIKMRIADDGIGFDINAVKGGIGLSNMRRRVELFYGRFDIFSSPGNGCELVIDIPLKAENLTEEKKSEGLINKLI
jgi:PAS domain S-box-containing protein